MHTKTIYQQATKQSQYFPAYRKAKDTRKQLKFRRLIGQLSHTSMSRGNTQPMKVVFINTQYVETDATSFKSVVQRLTGKDSMVSNEPMAAEFAKKTAKSSIGVRSGVGRMSGTGDGSVLSSGMSFKELDRLAMELPPLDELTWLFTD